MKKENLNQQDGNGIIADVIGSAVVWNAPDSYDGERTLSQHAFVSKQRGKFYEEKYEGNESLCGKIGIANEHEKYIPVGEIDEENFDETKACKRCVTIARQRHYL
jgi:hypothetical protein